MKRWLELHGSSHSSVQSTNDQTFQQKFHPGPPPTENVTMGGHICFVLQQDDRGQQLLCGQHTSEQNDHTNWPHLRDNDNNYSSPDRTLLSNTGCCFRCDIRGFRDGHVLGFSPPKIILTPQIFRHRRNLFSLLFSVEYSKWRSLDPPH